MQWETGILLLGAGRIQSSSVDKEKVLVRVGFFCTAEVSGYEGEMQKNTELTLYKFNSARRKCSY